MAIAQAYPLGTPKTNDLLVGTSIPAANTDDQPTTRNFSVGDVIALATGTLLQAKKSTITTQQLKDNTSIRVIDVPDGQIADVISVIFKVNNQTAANKISVNYSLNLQTGTGSGLVPYSYSLPDSIINTNDTDDFYKPVLNAGRSGSGYSEGSVFFINNTAFSPIIVGTPTTTVDIYVTYRLIKV